jgi:hypothetical protein
MTETLCTSGAVKLKAGANAPTLTAAQYTDLINKAEAFAAVQARYDWVTNYAALPDLAKNFLQDLTSSHAAIAVINNDMSGFTSRMEAQTMLDVNYSKVVDNTNMLRDDKFKTFLVKGSVD